MASTIQPSTITTTFPTLEHSEKEALQVDVLNFLQTQELAPGSLLNKQVLQVTTAAFIPQLFSHLPFEALKTLFSTDSSSLEAYQELIAITPQELKVEVMKLLFTRMGRSIPSFIDLVSRFQWRDSDAVEFIRFTASCDYQGEIIDRFEDFHIQEESSKVEALKILVLHLWDRQSKFIDVFEKFQIQEEANRTMLIEFLMSVHQNPTHALTSFSKFGITEDQNKSKILTALIGANNWYYSATAASIPIEFSSKTAEWLAYRNAVESNPTHLRDFMLYTSHPLLLRASIEHFRSPAGSTCLHLIDRIENDFIQLRTLKWLAQTLIHFHEGIDPNVMHSSDVPKMLGSLLTLRNPTLRDRLTLAYFNFLKNKSALELKANRTAKERETLFHSKFTQPVQTLLRRSQASPEAKKLLLSLNLSQFSTLHFIFFELTAEETLSYQNKFDLYLRRKENAQEHKNFIKESSVGELCAIAASQLSFEEKGEINAIFQSYASQRELFSLENFESELLDPVLKLLKNHKELIPKFKRELAAFIINESVFLQWLNKFPIDESTKHSIHAHFMHYRDAPPKFNFHFIELYCDLLRSMGCDQILLDYFSKTVTPTLDLHYFRLLEVLDELHRFPLSTGEKNVIMGKLSQAFSCTPHRKSPPEAIKTVSEEISALITIFLFAKQQQSLPPELFQQGTFASIARRIILETLSLEDQSDLIERFQEHFLCPEMEGLFPSYIAKLQALHEDSVMRALKKAVESVLNDTYKEDRYLDSPHCQKLKEEHPEKYEIWKEIQHISKFQSPSTENLYTLKSSTHYLDILLCGVRVHGSCVSIAGDGSRSRGVLAYLDGKFLPLLIEDQNETTLSRSYLVLDYDENNLPILLLERNYNKYSPDPSHNQKIEELAIAIAQKLGFPLIVNNNPQHEGTYSKGAPYTGKIISLGNGWSPYEQTDAGAIFSEGAYEIKDEHLQYLYRPQSVASSSGPQEV